MSTLFKGLTRPALIRGLGVPLYPFLGMCIICVLLGVWIHEAMYAHHFFLAGMPSGV